MIINIANDLLFLDMSKKKKEREREIERIVFYFKEIIYVFFCIDNRLFHIII